MLRRTEREHGRPTEAVQQQLMRSWNWTVDQMTPNSASNSSMLR